MNIKRREELISDLYRSAYGEDFKNDKLHSRSEFDEGTGTLYVKGEQFDRYTALDCIAQLQKHIKKIQEIARPENSKNIRLYELAIICIKKQFNLPFDENVATVQNVSYEINDYIV